MNDNLRLLSFVFAPILLLAYLIIAAYQPTVEVREVVVEREVTKEVLNITSVDHVCHAGRSHFLVRYGDNGWMVVARPTGHNDYGAVFATECDGDEVEHPGRKKE